MSPLIALFIVTWAAIIMLFLGLGANMREIRLLRITLQRTDSYSSAAPDLRLGGSFAQAVGQQIVLAADPGCPLCVAVAERLVHLSALSGVKAVLLTHAEAERWPAQIRAGVTVVSDPQVWRAIAHLSPPALLMVGPDGAVNQVILPIDVPEADKVIGSWMHMSTSEGVHA